MKSFNEGTAYLKHNVAPMPTGTFITTTPNMDYVPKECLVELLDIKIKHDKYVLRRQTFPGFMFHWDKHMEKHRRKLLTKANEWSKMNKMRLHQSWKFIIEEGDE
jgi:hypothetical protein